MVRLRDSFMFDALRYYWIIAKGYRLRPWDSPYIQWRFETFFGKEAVDLDARKFFPSPSASEVPFGIPRWRSGSDNPSNQD